MSKKLLRTNPVRLDTNAWSVEEHYLVPEASFQSEMAALWGRSPTVVGIPASGRFAPQAVAMPTNWHYYGKGLHRIIAQYRTLSTDEYMERYPSKGVVLMLPAMRMETIKYDKNGILVNGVDPTDPTGATVYKIVSGPSTVRRPLLVYRVHAIISSKSIWIDQHADKLGMINSNFMSRLGRYGAGKGELLFTRMAAAPLQWDKSKYVVDYDFAWTGQRGVVWNRLSVSRMFKRRVVEVPYVDSDGEETDVTRPIYAELPTDTWKYAPMYGEKNFGMINNLCSW